MSLVKLLRQLAKPDAKTVATNIEATMLWNRNQNVIKFLLVHTFFFLLYAITTGTSPTLYHLINLAFFLLIMITFVLNCRSDPGIFNFLYPFICGLYGILLTYLVPEKLFEVWITALISPLFFAAITGNYICLVFGTISQMALMGLYYNQRLEEYFKRIDSNVLAESLIHVSMTRMIMGVGLIIIQQEVVKTLKTTYLEFIHTKESDAERRNSFIEAFFVELKDIVQSFSNAIHFTNHYEIPMRVKDELGTCKTGIDLLLHIVENFLERGSNVICDFEVSPTYTQIYSCIEKTWSLCIETIRAKGLRASLRVEKKCPGVLKLDNYRLFQILLNLIGHSLKTSRHGTINITIKWQKGSSKVTKESFEPLPYEDDGIYEKDIMVEALHRKKGEDDYYMINFDKLKFVEEALMNQKKASQGVLKILYTDSGSDGWNSVPFSNSFSHTEDGNASSRMKKSIGLYMTKEICRKMGGDIKAFTKQGKGLAFVVCIPVGE